MRSLGEAIGADPSAVYRHVRDKDELLRAVGDRLLQGVVDGLPGAERWGGRGPDGLPPPARRAAWPAPAWLTWPAGRPPASRTSTA